MGPGRNWLGAAAWVLLWTSGAPAGTPGDGQIAKAVETAMALDHGASARKVDAEVEGGIVTLTGTVDSLLARESAVEAASMVKGVRAVIDRVRVRPPARLDAQITSDVLAALAADPATDSFEIRVEADGGRIVLRGRVDSRQEKLLAGRVAKGIRGVAGLDNRIEIAPSGKRPDPEIRADIARRLLHDLHVDASTVDVEVDSGRVSLTGRVGSLHEKNQAYADAWVAGVRAVDIAGLEVVPGTREGPALKKRPAAAPDAEVAKAVQDALLYDPRVNMFDVDVRVRGGTALLSGVVDNLGARRAAARDARNTVGVLRVENRIQVRPAAADCEDPAVLQRLQNTLARDPLVSGHAIDIQCSGGRVVLQGTVDSKQAALRAGELAARTRGVVEVRNRLDPAPRSHRGRRDDRALRRTIKGELFWNPWIDATRIVVVVDAGVVTLHGEVDGRLRRMLAIQAAYAAGARKVRDRMKYSWEQPEKPSP